MQFAVFDFPYNEFSILLLLGLSVLGVAGLCFGGDWLARGAAGIAIQLQINPVVVGLTVVALATSMPEWITSMIAIGESPGLAIGNIVGSNIANIGLILGVSALIAPIAVKLQLLRRDVPLLLVASLLFVVFATRGLGRLEGAILLAFFIGYIVHTVRSAVRESSEVRAEFGDDLQETGAKSMKVLAALVVVGTVALAIGAKVLVDASVEIADRMGISDALIGITLVAIGTSLPELAASVAAALRGHSDICAGNVVGSNLFNLVLIGGSVSMVHSVPVDPLLFRVEFPAMLGLTVLLLFFFRSGHVVSRREGCFLLALYGLILGLSSASQLKLF